MTDDRFAMGHAMDEDEALDEYLRRADDAVLAGLNDSFDERAGLEHIFALHPLRRLRSRRQLRQRVRRNRQPQDDHVQQPDANKRPVAPERG